VWLFLNYVLQSIGELLIMPIGYAMIGKLAPRRYQGIMMGSWVLVTGLASLFAGDFSGMIPEPTGTTAVATNPEYAKLFAELGFGSLAVGIALVVLIGTHSLAPLVRCYPCSVTLITRTASRSRQLPWLRCRLPADSVDRDVFYVADPSVHSVPAQADHRQGRECSRRSGYRRSGRLTPTWESHWHLTCVNEL
jgi:MFS family permease